MRHVRTGNAGCVHIHDRRRTIGESPDDERLSPGTRHGRHFCNSHVHREEHMRLRVYGCAAALVTLAITGCDRTPRVENIAPDSDRTATAPAREHSDPMITARV